MGQQTSAIPSAGCWRNPPSTPCAAPGGRAPACSTCSVTSRSPLRRRWGRKRQTAGPTSPRSRPTWIALANTHRRPDRLLRQSPGPGHPPVSDGQCAEGRRNRQAGGADDPAPRRSAVAAEDDHDASLGGWCGGDGAAAPGPGARPHRNHLSPAGRGPAAKGLADGGGQSGTFSGRQRRAEALAARGNHQAEASQGGGGGKHAAVRGQDVPRHHREQPSGNDIEQSEGRLLLRFLGQLGSRSGSPGLCLERSLCRSGFCGCSRPCQTCLHRPISC